MAHTQKDTFAHSADAVAVTAENIVYSGSLNCTQGLNTFYFTTPFQYNGTDNVVLVINDHSSFASDCPSCVFYVHNAPKKTLYKSDYMELSPDNLIGGQVLDVRNDVVFLVDCDETITCIAPNALVSNVGERHATLEWVAGHTETSWEVQYKAVMDVEWTLAGTVAESPYMLENLSGNTSYNVRIRSVCDPEYSDWTTLAFRTECAAIDALPYIENFDNSVAGSGSFTDCWITGNNGSTNNYPHITDYNAFSASNAASFLGNTTFYSYAATPRFDESIAMNDLHISLYAYKFTTESQIEVGIMTDPNDINTFTTVGVLSPDTLDTWKYVYLTTNAYTGDGRYVAFRAPQTVNTDMFIDNLTIQPMPTCPEVEGLTASFVDANSAAITWTYDEEDGTSFEYIYGESGTVDFNAEELIEPVMEFAVILTDLTGNTDYDVYVRRTCAGDDKSPWALVRFTTDCDAVTIPYTHNFDADETGAGHVPSCWNIIQGGYDGISPYVTSAQSNSPDHSLYYDGNFYANNNGGYAVLPTIDVANNPINTLQINFYARKKFASSRGVVIVGVMPDQTDTASFVPVDTVEATTLDFQEYWVTFDVYEGTYSCIALYFPLPETDTYYNQLYLDDIIVQTISTCPRPTDVQVTGVTMNSVTLTWTDNSSASEWNIMYCPAGSDPATAGSTVPADANPYTVTGLPIGTYYDFYVRAVCSAEDQSAWSGPVTAATHCDVITTFPYLEDFEHDGIMSPCWSQEYVSGAVQWICKSGNHSGGNIAYAQSGFYNAYFQTTEHGDRTKLISPVFDLTPMANPYLAFWYSQEAWYTDQDQLRVYYRTSETGEWVELAHYTDNVSSWTRDSVALPNPSATYQIAFEGQSEYGRGITVDDVTVFDAPVVDICDAPTGLSAATTTNTATVTWNETGAFEVACKTAASDWSANTGVTGNTYTFTNLNAETAYSWRVRQICDGNSVSDWAEGTFTTEPESVCPMPTNLQVTEITGNSATLSWTQEGEVSNWTLNYRKTGANWTTAEISTNPYTITDLETATAYEAQLRSNCADGSSSEYTEPITFTTTSIEDYDLSNSISLYPNPANNFIDVKFNDDMEISSVSLYDVYGKLLQTISVTENPVRINVSDFADGMYFVKAMTDKGVVNKPFIKK